MVYHQCLECRNRIQLKIIIIKQIFKSFHNQRKLPYSIPFMHNYIRCFTLKQISKIKNTKVSFKIVHFGQSYTYKYTKASLPRISEVDLYINCIKFNAAIQHLQQQTCISRYFFYVLFLFTYIKIISLFAHCCQHKVLNQSIACIQSEINHVTMW